MKKTAIWLIVLVVIFSMATTALAQTGGPGGAPVAGPGFPFLLDDVEEAALTEIMDFVGFGPPGGNRVGVSYSYGYGMLSFDTMVEFGLPCSAVTVYRMDDVSQLHLYEGYTCDGNVLSFFHPSLTHFYYYGNISAPPGLVSLFNAG